MPALENIAPPPVPVWTVRTSLVFDWYWALLVKSPEEEQQYPARTDRFASDPGLLSRIEGFWGDSSGGTSHDEWIELVSLARRAGVLWTDDRDTALKGLRQAVSHGVQDESFDSETPEVAKKTERRLERLSREPELAEKWLELISDVDAAVRRELERVGTLQAERTRRNLLPAADSAAAWPSRDLVGCLCISDTARQALCENAITFGGEVVVVPSYLACEGCFLAFGDLVLLGVQALKDEPAVLAGDATETVARKLKALADSTRLAIVQRLAIRPTTIGSLAHDLSVSQPTVSNHVRLLRDAGIVVDDPEGHRRRLAVDQAVLRQVLRELELMVLGTPT